MKKHRIGFNLDAPVRLFGMTIDELALLIVGFLTFVIARNKFVGLGLFFGSGALVVLLKRFKKQASGFRLKSFLFWHIGLKSRTFTCPPSHTRNLK